MFGFVNDIANYVKKGLSAPHEDPAHISTSRGDVQQAQADASRGEQQGLGDFWQNQMAGKGPSVAELQLRQGAQMAGQQARATAASARGANMALAGRGAAIGASNAVMGVNNQAAQLRAGEQLAGAQQYQQLLQAQRQQDLMARGLSEQEAIAQLQAETAVKTGNLQAASQAKGAGFGLVGGGMSILSGSDERTKQNVESVSGDEPDASVPELVKGTKSDSSSSGGDLGGLLGMLSDTLAKDNVLPYGEYTPNPPSAAFPVGPNGTVPRVETAYDAAPPPTARYANAPSAAPRFAPSRMQFRPQDVQPAPAFGPDTNPLAPQFRNMDYMSKGAGPEVQREMDARDKKELEKLTKKEGEGEGEKDKGPNGWQIGGGLGMIGMGLMAMSDKDTKQHIDDLKAENFALRKTMAKTGSAILQHLPMPGQKPFIPQNEAEAAQYGAEWNERNQRAMDRDMNDVVAYRARAASANQRLTAAESRRATSQPVDEAWLAQPGQIPSDTLTKDNIFGIGPAPAGLYPSRRHPESVGRLPDVRPSVGRMPDVHPLSDAFAQVPAKEWEYKPEFAAEANQSRGLPPDDEFGRRRQVGPMAQDFERIPELAPAVKEGPDGVKRVDTGRVAMTSASAIGELSRRLDELEGLKLREMKAAGKGRR